MNRNQAKEILPIIQAFIDGKQIQHLYNKWEDIENLTSDLIINPELYRIKPESKYRPFKNAEECLNEMQKHQPFGWIKNCGVWYNIVSTDVASVNIINTRGAIATLDFRHLLANYHFADGTLFGIKIGEG